MSSNHHRQSLSGRLIERRTARQLLREIIGMDESEYDHYIRALTVDQKIRHEQELVAFQDVCTVMTVGYKQWASQLMLKAPPDKNGFLKSKYSSLVAVYSCQRAAVQSELRIVLEGLQSQRKRFLELLHEQLRPDEIKRYKSMLEIGFPMDCLMPDIEAVQVVYKLDSLFGLAALVPEAEVRSLKGASIEVVVERGLASSKQAFEIALETLASVVEKQPKQESDSLAAQMMLAAALNRSALEDLEYQRYEMEAAPQLQSLVQMMTDHGVRHLPLHLCDAFFERWLVELFNGEHFIPAGSAWRTLKISQVEHLKKRVNKVIAHALSIWEGAEPLNEAVARKVCLVTLCWSYCTKEQHDLRIPKSKVLDLVSGKPEQSSRMEDPTLVFVHYRYLASLLLSHQDKALSIDMLQAYHKTNMHKRTWRRELRERVLRGASLADWEAVGQGIEKFVEYLKTQCVT